MFQHRKRIEPVFFSSSSYTTNFNFHGKILVQSNIKILVGDKKRNKLYLLTQMAITLSHYRPVLDSKLQLMELKFLQVNTARNSIETVGENCTNSGKITYDSSISRCTEITLFGTEIQRNI